MLADELQNLIMLDNMYSWLEAKLFQLKMSELKEAKFKSLFPERGQSFCEKSLWSESSQDWGHKFCNLFPVLIQICVRESEHALYIEAILLLVGEGSFFMPVGHSQSDLGLKGRGQRSGLQWQQHTLRPPLARPHLNAALGSDLWLLHRFQDYLLGLESWFVIRQRIVNYWGWLGGKRWGNWL